ncbi:hypothetical protein K1W54_35105 [Micromonospora sp. CPCC 205371]|nr:hypothetical protein [Micromonospora sp. CPCC 205371]
MTVRDERDTWLAGLARAGHGRALDELLERHWSLIHHIVGCGLVEHSDVDRALTTLAARLRDTAPDGGEQVRAWFAAEARRQVRSSRRSGRVGADGPDFAATAVAGLGLTGQARHLAEPPRWLAPHDRDTFALWWPAESGELTAAEVAAASGGSPSDSDARVRRMAPRLDAARRLVAALAADPVCGDLALLAGGTARRPEPHRRDRLATHVAECSRCATDLEPVEPLLGSLGLVPAPAVPAPASRPSAQSRSAAAASTMANPDRRQNSGGGWRRFTRPRGPALPPPPDPSPWPNAPSSPDLSPSPDPSPSPDAAAAPGVPSSSNAAFLPGAASVPDAASSPGAALPSNAFSAADSSSPRAAFPPGMSGSSDSALQRGAAGARRYAGRRNSTASWGDLATGGADPDAGDLTVLDSRGSVAGSAGVRRMAGSRGSGGTGGSSGWSSWRGSSARPRSEHGPRAVVASRAGSAAAALPTRLAGPLAWAAEAGLRGAAAVRGLASRVAAATSGLRYRGRRFRPTGLPRRAILVALAVAMFVVVAVVANRATRSAAPVHDPEPVITTTAPEPSPAAVTTAPGTPPAIGLAPPARAAAPDRTTGPGVTSAAAVPPAARPPATTSYEAEAARLSGAAEATTMPGASGGRVVHKLGTGTSNPYGYTERGAIEFSVNAPTSRRYTVTVYYVSGEQRTAYVRVNSGQSQAWTFRPAAWNEVTSATFQLDLRAGPNTVYFHNPAYWMPRLDRLTVTG